MATLLLRLVGPMQAWGISSRFDDRDTGKEPSKSGVIGLLAAALGIDRGAQWDDARGRPSLKSLAELRMGARHDRSGVLKCDYQTVGGRPSNGFYSAGMPAPAEYMRGDRDQIIKAGGGLADNGIISPRHYLADAKFLVGLEGEKSLLAKVETALKNPVWTLFLGRKSYVPSKSIYLPDGLQDAPLGDALKNYPSLDKPDKDAASTILLSLESKEFHGSMRMDQPLSNFQERKFGARYVSAQIEPMPPYKEII